MISKIDLYDRLSGFIKKFLRTFLIPNKITALFFLLLSQYAYSSPFVTEGNNIIDSKIVYDGINLNLTENKRVYFTITNNGHLTINNSHIKVVLSPENTFFIQLIKGEVTLKNTTVEVIAKNIQPTPRQSAVHHLIKNLDGTLNLINNRFKTTSNYTVGLISSSFDYKTRNHFIANNTISKFHGGIHLLNASHSIVKKNTLDQVSYNAIFGNGEDLKILNNTIFFSGNMDVGDGIVLIKAKNALIQGNKIYGGSCYGIQITDSNFINIRHNTIVDGVTYAIYLSSTTYPSYMYTKYFHKLLLINESLANANITISHNYLSQNRYGLAAENSINLNVHDNIFSQRFSNPSSRLFWTDNTILLQNTRHLSWVNNYYKEAYTQINEESKNDNSKKFVLFPKFGGVIL